MTVEAGHEVAGTREERPLAAPASGRLPRPGRAGAAVLPLAAVALLLATILLVLRWRPVTLLFTPLAWTCYIVLADAIVYRRLGTSLIRGRPREFLLMLPWSVVTWLIFEFYNLRLHNWHYVGEPASLLGQVLLGAWSFATIFPGVLETTDLLGSFGPFERARMGRWRPRHTTLYALMALGATLLIVPLLVPETAARHWFGAVWIGFILLLDPFNYLRGARSLLGEWSQGRLTLTLTLLAAGVVTGLLWESWNYWAAARWVYTVPPPLGWGPRIFEMPPLGFLGFLPFAIEIYCLQALLVARRPPDPEDEDRHDCC